MGRDASTFRSRIRLAASVVTLLALSGCSPGLNAVVLREPDSFVKAADRPGRYVLADSSAEADALVGHLAQDSLMLYRQAEHEGSMTLYRLDAHTFSGKGLDIAGYTLASGKHVHFPGWVKRDGDSLRFFPKRPSGMEAKSRLGRHAVSLSSVRSLDVWLVSPEHTVVVTLVVAAFIAFTALAVRYGGGIGGGF
jgi:hypothetical protein